jgi:RimJ/RimL family protein N-acetyltransferase
MSAPAEVRRLGAHDAAIYQAIRAEMLIDTPSSFGSSPEDDKFQDAAFAEGVLSHATNGVFGFFDADGECQSVAGFIRPDSLKRRHVGEVWGVYTRPAGRRRGAAARVMAAVIEHARGLDGVEQIQLSVSSEAAAAEALYLGLGFEVWGREPKALRLGDRRPDEIHMSLPL